MLVKVAVVYWVSLLRLNNLCVCTYIKKKKQKVRKEEKKKTIFSKISCGVADINESLQEIQICMHLHLHLYQKGKFSFFCLKKKFKKIK